MHVCRKWDTPLIEAVRTADKYRSKQTTLSHLRRKIWITEKQVWISRQVIVQ